ncbi:hypothetical protein K2173_015368 [Erythroxylum novogranatense]|uniref:Wax synthase domain-containing protein n=1 Tax=Erythroxylum novogranatense TaxID=1862640 RepID=A0AAV8SRH0_9ROSI|nr:hypothetical protein K2173_015368 [Erythroxylum novogranatense]
MEGDEFKNLIRVWVIASACLCYCYYVSSRVPKGILRLLSLLPIFYLFIILPLDLTILHLCCPTAFFLTWLATFKLLLFSIDQGPLYPPPPSVFHFICLACLPIKLKHNETDTNPSHKSVSQSNANLTSSTTSPLYISKPLMLLVKLLLLLAIFHSYNYRQFVNSYIILALYCVHLYLELEIMLAICATPALGLFGFQLEPQFNEPYLTTSLQDFWGRRWNLMVTSILRPTVYNPVRRFFTPAVGQAYAALPAILLTFVVSGLIHEMFWFYMTRVSPTWEVTWFFVLHGVCMNVEVVVKRMVGGRRRLHRSISGPLTIGFLGVTAVWLFFPQILRNEVDIRVIGEYSMLKDKITHLVSQIYTWLIVSVL